MFPFNLFAKKYPVVCPYCFKTVEDRMAVVCPHCAKEFPLDYAKLHSPFIAIVGAAAAGKSHYIATLIQQIYTLDEKYNWGLSALSDETTDEYNNKYKIPLYDEIKTIDKTAQQQKNVPLLYDMRTPLGQHITLAFFDTAGEHFDSQTAMVDYTPYVCNASGIILLLDPLQQWGLRDKLPRERSNRLPKLDSRNGDAKDMTERLNRVIREGKKLSRHKKITIPLAIAFSKMDEFRDIADIKDSPVYRPSQHNGGVNLAEINDISESMGGWVKEVIPGLSGVTKQFKNVKFFGISALGEPPENKKLNSRPRPMRVEDPFLWLLYQNGFIKGTNPRVTVSPDDDDGSSESATPVDEETLVRKKRNWLGSVIGLLIAVLCIVGIVFAGIKAKQAMDSAKQETEQRITAAEQRADDAEKTAEQRFAEKTAAIQQDADNKIKNAEQRAAAAETDRDTKVAEVSAELKGLITELLENWTKELEEAAVKTENSNGRELLCVVITAGNVKAKAEKVLGKTKERHYLSEETTLSIEHRIKTASNKIIKAGKKLQTP